MKWKDGQRYGQIEDRRGDYLDALIATFRARIIGEGYAGDAQRERYAERLRQAAELQRYHDMQRQLDAKRGGGGF